jgi:hypothetical protein
VTLTYQKVDTNDLILEDWKRYLDLTEKAIFESELSDYDWYLVIRNPFAVSFNFTKRFSLSTQKRCVCRFG